MARKTQDELPTTANQVDARLRRLSVLEHVTPPLAAELVRLADEVTAVRDERDELIIAYNTLHTQLGKQRAAIVAAFHEKRFLPIDIAIMAQLEKLDAVLLHRAAVFFLDARGRPISASDLDWRVGIKGLLGRRPLSWRDVFLGIANNLLTVAFTASTAPGRAIRRWETLLDALPILGFEGDRTDARLLSQHVSGVLRSLRELEPRFDEVMGLARGWEMGGVRGIQRDLQVEPHVEVATAPPRASSSELEKRPMRRPGKNSKARGAGRKQRS